MVEERELKFPLARFSGKYGDFNKYLMRPQVKAFRRSFFTVSKTRHCALRSASGAIGNADTRRCARLCARPLRGLRAYAGRICPNIYMSSKIGNDALCRACKICSFVRTSLFKYSFSIQATTEASIRKMLITEYTVLDLFNFGL